MTDRSNHDHQFKKACALLVRGDLHNVEIARVRCIGVHGGPVIVHEAVPFDPFDVQLDWNVLADARAALFEVLFVPGVDCLGADNLTRLRLFEKLVDLKISVLTIGQAGAAPVALRELMSNVFAAYCMSLAKRNTLETLCV